MDDCNTQKQMGRYYETARSFDENFPENTQMSNCEHVDYIPHDYWTDSTYETLDNSKESGLNVGFLSFYRKVSLKMSSYS